MMIHRWAVIKGQQKQYRYRLSRSWESEKGGVLRVCMLNPSTADAETDDQTITRLIRRAQDEGLGALSVVNLFAYRATDKSHLDLAMDPVGPENDDFIREQARRCKREGRAMLLGWGDLPKFRNRNMEDRPGIVLKMLKKMNVRVECLGTTVRKNPRHPLYISYDVQPQPYV